MKEIPYHNNYSYIQPLHAIVKENKKVRLVVDFSRNLNEFLVQETFKYATTQDAVNISTLNDWYVKADITNCYISFPISKETAEFCIIKLGHKYYKFVTMPFGLGSAPLICTKLLAVIQSVMESRGCKLIRYLDDTLFVASTELEATNMLQTAREVYREFGLIMNEDKTIGPTQRITFLGVIIDSVKQTLESAPERVQQLCAQLLQAKQRSSITRQEFDSLLGRLSFAAQVLPGARPFTRQMRDEGLNCSDAPNAKIPVSEAFKEDIDFWFNESIAGMDGRSGEPATVLRTSLRRMHRNQALVITWSEIIVEANTSTHRIH